MPTQPAAPRTTACLLRDYFRAKDENRPLYMARAFAPDAVLKMALRTQAIAFPPESHGLAAIADTLSRKFGQTYDNVYTFYLAHPGEHAVLPGVLVRLDSGHDGQGQRRGPRRVRQL